MITMNVKGPGGASVKAMFRIVLQTTGRPKTESKAVPVSFEK